MKKNINKNIFKVLLIILSLSIFLTSLTFDAFSYEYQGVKMMSSLSCFVTGSLAILGGGTLEWLIWLANPLCLISIFCLIMDKNLASKFNFTALILAISFYSWNSVLASESGTSGKILSVELGYFIWLASITVLTIGTKLYFRKYSEIKYTE
ncbi:hypothetical protein FVB9288_03022 [Flavobacterium sp. CECT 9288]|uniref:hypothetical protein n=1 Tax=Flavobacterium sp. CECT 9288 TaxID=2845819 RepID=UPI001E306AF5|nr:hypothetical protein [Flavobacterium sp. CECT 9288]CAH0337269.1 hypothetical protein FVB9288_03022 [Flavobacterium sp. CECT 9288]